MSQVKAITSPNPRPGLPVRLGSPTERPSLARSGPRASFISQLIAAREPTAPQSQRHRANLGAALDAYRSGAEVSVVRLPQGYRKTRIV